MLDSTSNDDLMAVDQAETTNKNDRPSNDDRLSNEDRLTNEEEDGVDGDSATGTLLFNRISKLLK